MVKMTYVHITIKFLKREFYIVAAHRMEKTGRVNRGVGVLTGQGRSLVFILQARVLRSKVIESVVLERYVMTTKVTNY